MKKLGKEAISTIMTGSCDSEHSLKELLERDAFDFLVIYFYPADNTPLCTVQGRHYTELLEKFIGLKALPIGISEGTAKGKKEFSSSCKYQHLLLADGNHCLAKAFGSFTAEGGDEHKNSQVERKTFIINNKYEIIYADENVKFASDAKSTLNFLQKLNR